MGNLNPRPIASSPAEGQAGPSTSPSSIFANLEKMPKSNIRHIHHFTKSHLSPAKIFPNAQYTWKISQVENLTGEFSQMQELHLESFPSLNFDQKRFPNAKRALGKFPKCTFACERAFRSKIKVVEFYHC